MKSALHRYITLFVLNTIVASALSHESVTINDGWSFRFLHDSGYTSVHLPHCWNEDAYHTRHYYRGEGMYKKDLYIPSAVSGSSLYLKFDGAATSSIVLIDGDSIGSHIGGYSPYVVDITPYVVPGSTHELTVIVDNADKNIPPYSADFTFMGGLYRDAWLIIAPPIHFDISDGPKSGITVMSNISGTGIGDVSISGDIVNSTGKSQNVKVKAMLLSPDGKIAATAAENVKIAPSSSTNNFQINLNNLRDVKLWSPESPDLYNLTVVIEQDGKIIDKTTEYTAFRTFAFDGQGQFLLNGRPYKLRGMCRHQDQKPMGIALTDEQHRRDMEMIKEMGANFIRISHYPQDDAILDMCDRLGLIAWEEIPVIDYVPDSDEFADNCETMLREMIHSHYNHPSIAMWGYMNEILLRMPHDNQDITKSRTLDLAKRLENVVRDEDPSRMSTMAFHGSDVYHGAGIAEITDVKGWNLYQGWYGGSFDGFEDFLSRQHRQYPDHKLIVSEYGAGSDLRIHSLKPEAFDFSMEYQQQYLEHYLPVIEDSVFVAGASHWNFIDFSSANRAESMPHINNKGLVTNDRRKKDVYYYYKSAWTDLSNDTVAHIATRDWPERTDIIDESGKVIRPVKVYTNLPEIVMFFNGENLGSKEVSNNNAVFDIRLIPGNNVITVYSVDNPQVPLDVATINLKTVKAENGVIDLATSELAVNVGSDCYFRSDDTGLTWLPDAQYMPGGLYGNVGGKRKVSQDEIALTSDEPLLQHCLVGLNEYRFDVKPGRYEVELTFADLSSPSALSAYMLGHNSGSGDAAPADMDIFINGVQEEKAFSPAKVSGVKTMVKRRYFTDVSDDNRLSVSFAPSESGTTLLSAIKIRKL